MTRSRKGERGKTGRRIAVKQKPLDLLDRASAVEDSGQLDLREISQLVHKTRRMKGQNSKAKKLESEK